MTVTANGVRFQNTLRIFVYTCITFRNCKSLKLQITTILTDYIFED